MNGFIAGFLSIGFLVVINIVVVAYGYGKLNQKVLDLCRRVSNLEASYKK